jgi:hypothetical protein
VNTLQATCPLCQRPNRCDANSASGRCWCFNVQVPAALLAHLPDDQRNTACICYECIVQFLTENPENKNSLSSIEARTP